MPANPATSRYPIAQDADEIAAFVDLLIRENVRSYLEVGAKFGGSMARVGDALARGASIVAVDMPRGTKAWNESHASLSRCIADLNSSGHAAKVIWGDSTDPKVIEQVKALGPFDAILIDANHTRPYVEQDWANYGPMGRMVAFHDIAWRRAPEWIGVRIDVPQFWSEIKSGFRHQEFKFCPTGKNNGIGVLWH
jgi:predicted O-methyltransferase YrrM